MSLISGRLFRTTAFRTALAFAVAFSLLAAVGMGVIYWATKSHIEEQIDSRLRLETDVLLKLYRAQAMPALLDTIRRRNHGDFQQIFFYLLWGPQHRWLAGQPPPVMNGFDVQRTYATLRLGDVFQVDAPESNDRVRILATSLPGGYRLLVGRDLNEEKALLKHALTVILAVTMVIFLVALMASVVMGHQALRRIDAISRTASDIMAGNLSKRLPISPRNNEFDQLSHKLNAMLERIEQLMAGMRQVSDNLAHDLRKPLNRLRSRLDITLLEARSEGEYREVLEQGIDDADELLKTFNALLSIAQAEAGVKRSQSEWGPVELQLLAEDVVDLYGALAEDAEIELKWSAKPALRVTGNRQLLAQALGNLLDNAVKYTPPGGTITLTIDTLRNVPTITVDDSGPGIPAAERERALQRFVRLDSARQLPGNGLGLSLVKAVAKLHGAELVLDDNRPGLRVSLRFTDSGQITS